MDPQVRTWRIFCKCAPKRGMPSQMEYPPMNQHCVSFSVPSSSSAKRSTPRFPLAPWAKVRTNRMGTAQLEGARVPSVRGHTRLEEVFTRVKGRAYVARSFFTDHPELLKRMFHFGFLHEFTPHTHPLADFDLASKLQFNAKVAPRHPRPQVSRSLSGTRQGSPKTNCPATWL